MAYRRSLPTQERDQATREIDWQRLLDQALTAPGQLSSSYNRFYTYSYINQLLLLMQGVREPVATYQRWQTIGRQVLKGSHAKEIVRPIVIEKKDNAGEVTDKILRFKPVRCLFTYSETSGPDIPMPAVPDWSLEQALQTLDITRVPYTMLAANASGYSFGRNLAISPVDKEPLMTALHEMAHIEHGHTTESQVAQYREHRGIKEFEAEGSAYLVANELQCITETQHQESRGYLQSWLQGQRPPDASIRRVFGVTDRILRAGRLATAEVFETIEAQNNPES